MTDERKRFWKEFKKKSFLWKIRHFQCWLFGFKCGCIKHCDHLLHLDDYGRICANHDASWIW